MVENTFPSCSQDRMQLWRDQFHHYHTETLDFKKLTAEVMDGLRKEHGLIAKDLEGAAERMDRVEREMEYVESQTSPRACAKQADKVVEQEAWGPQEREEEEEEDWTELHSRVSGELHAHIDQAATTVTTYCTHRMYGVYIAQITCPSEPPIFQSHCFGKVTALENVKQTGRCFRSLRVCVVVFSRRWEPSYNSFISLPPSLSPAFSL